MLDSMPKAVSVPWMPSFTNVYLRPVSYMPPMDTLAAQTADDAAAARSAAQAAQRERGNNFGLNVIIWRSLVWFDWRAVITFYGLSWLFLIEMLHLAG